MAKVPRNWKALQNGTIWSVLMHEFGLYPKAWTREARGKFPLAYLPWTPKQRKKPKTEAQKAVELAQSKQTELTKLYRAMGV
jgi:hypothetical protein